MNGTVCELSCDQAGLRSHFCLRNRWQRTITLLPQTCCHYQFQVDCFAPNAASLIRETLSSLYIYMHGTCTICAVCPTEAHLWGLARSTLHYYRRLFILYVLNQPSVKERLRLTLTERRSRFGPLYPNAEAIALREESVVMSIDQESGVLLLRIQIVSLISKKTCLL